MHTLTGKMVFDLHCDTITECLKRGVSLDDDSLHLALGKLPDGWRLCQCTAVFMPDELRGDDAAAYFQKAYDTFLRQTDMFHDRVNTVRPDSEIDRLLMEKPFAFILTVEGGSVLAGKLESLDYLHSIGVKMMTLTWNDANEICGGAATDLGFTPFGKKVVRRMEQLGMIVDVSHLSDRGFRELCEFAGRPFVASHSNARAVCGHRRNLTDDMFREIVARGGLVGLNYAAGFIRDCGDTRTIADLQRHVYHFLELGGKDVLALGSDFDGTDLPPYLDGLDRIGVLWEALERAGIPACILEKIYFENARRFFAACSYELVSEGDANEVYEHKEQ